MEAMVGIEIFKTPAIYTEHGTAIFGYPGRSLIPRRKP
jgi:hypothetical protein